MEIAQPKGRPRWPPATLGYLSARNDLLLFIVPIAVSIVSSVEVVFTAQEISGNYHAVGITAFILSCVGMGLSAVTCQHRFFRQRPRGWSFWEPQLLGFLAFVSLPGPLLLVHFSAYTAA
jgi:hypothetical protein